MGVTKGEEAHAAGGGESPLLERKEKMKICEGWDSNPWTPSRTDLKSAGENVGPDSFPAGPINRIRNEGKHNRHDITVSVFYSEVSIADFQSTIAYVVRPASHSWYNFENHRSTPGPNSGLRKTRPFHGCTSPLS